jgi:predicted RNase H-like HicB family nuclease
VKVTVVLEPSDEGGYTAYIPSIPTCISEGDTKGEALQNIKEALLLFLQLEESEIVRDKPGTLIEKIEV